MKQQLSALICVFASVSLLLSCKKEIAPINENGSVSARSKMNAEKVPFKGTYVTTVQILSGPPMQLTRINGTGAATHLGESTFVALSTLNLTTPPPFSLGGTATFYAANGDMLYTTFIGTATPNQNGTKTVINAKITGGTGRFENASGTLTGTSMVNFSNPTNTITFEGNIIY